jgi:hypothetical protein
LIFDLLSGEVLCAFVKNFAPFVVKKRKKNERRYEIDIKQKISGRGLHNRYASLLLWGGTGRNKFCFDKMAGVGEQAVGSNHRLQISV